MQGRGRALVVTLIALCVSSPLSSPLTRAHGVPPRAGTSVQLRGSSAAKEATKKLEVYVDDTLVLCDPGTTLLQVRPERPALLNPKGCGRGSCASATGCVGLSSPPFLLPFLLPSPLPSTLAGLCFGWCGDPPFLLPRAAQHRRQLSHVSCGSGEVTQG